MNRDDIIKLAREAGSIDSEDVIETVWKAFTYAERDRTKRLVEDMQNELRQRRMTGRNT